MTREELFADEVLNLFTAYNKPVIPEFVESKTIMLFKTLDNLATDKIREFFQMIRETEGYFPSDAVMKKFLKDGAKKYSKVRFTQKQLPAYPETPSEWRKRLFEELKLVLSKKTRVKDSKARLGL